MKNIILAILFILLMTGVTNIPSEKKIKIAPAKYDLTLYQVNASWNLKNNIEGLKTLKGVNYEFVYYEDQQKKFKAVIKSVPVLLLYNKNNDLLWGYQPGVSLKASIDLKDVQKIIDSFSVKNVK